MLIGRSTADASCLCNGSRPLQIQRQQPLQHLLIGEIMRPAVGVEDGRIQLPVRQVEPGWSLVVEVGQRALLEFGFAHTWRVEPVIALFDQLARSLCDGLDAGLAHRLAPWGPGEGECLESHSLPARALGARGRGMSRKS